jgi:hypothetical protein
MIDSAGALMAVVARGCSGTRGGLFLIYSFAVTVPGPGGPRIATPEDVDRWCARWLGSPVGEALFTTGHLALVVGARLADGRDVVIKVRPDDGRLPGCVAVQEHLWRAGFPCPRPLAGPHPIHGYAATAELLVPGGGPLDPGSDGATAFATLLSDLVRLAPRVDAVPDLTPAPAWMHWYHDSPGVWPPPDDRPDDLNAHPETAWLDEIGARVRRRLAGSRERGRVIGHCDWEAQNITWRDGRAWAVHDWDSAVAEPETVIAGQASAVWPASAGSFGATVAQSEEFLDAYQRARGVAFTPAQVGEAWAAGLWVRSFNAKKWLLDGLDTLSVAEARERLRRAGG